jgi:hypothetical protein
MSTARQRSIASHLGENDRLGLFSGALGELADGFECAGAIATALRIMSTAPDKRRGLVFVQLLARRSMTFPANRGSDE